MELFLLVTALLGPALAAELNVVSTGDPLIVYVNGIDHGRTPLTLDFGTGTYTIRKTLVSRAGIGAEFFGNGHTLEITDSWFTSIGHAPEGALDKLLC